MWHALPNMTSETFVIFLLRRTTGPVSTKLGTEQPWSSLIKCWATPFSKGRELKKTKLA